MKKEEMLKLVKILKRRDKLCYEASPELTLDVATAALAEVYDESFFDEIPIGASDAIQALIEKGEKKGKELFLNLPKACKLSK